MKENTVLIDQWQTTHLIQLQDQVKLEDLILFITPSSFAFGQIGEKKLRLHDHGKYVGFT